MKELLPPAILHCDIKNVVFRTHFIIFKLGLLHILTCKLYIYADLAVKLVAIS